MPGREADDDRGQDTRENPVLRFSPYAWAKLLFFRDRGHTEIGGFGITPADDLLYIEDFITVQQSATVAGVTFEDRAVGQFLDDQVDAGRQPAQVLRIWCHTHPGRSPEPSCVDEETFSRVIGSCDHAVMFVLAKDGKSYARLRFNVGPAGPTAKPAKPSRLARMAFPGGTTRKVLGPAHQLNFVVDHRNKCVQHGRTSKAVKQANG